MMQAFRHGIGRVAGSSQRAMPFTRTTALLSQTRSLPSLAVSARRDVIEKANGLQPFQGRISPIRDGEGFGKNFNNCVDPLEPVKKNNLVFEIGFPFSFMHYQTIVPAAMRTLFQAFRPLLILFIFGQILKSVFFLAGTPIWFSFYSVWMFEVGYGLFQCVLSFLFIAFFYNNLSFARARPVVAQIINRQREVLRAK